MRAFIVTVPVDDVDVASDALWQLGVRAIEERLGEADDVVELWTAVGDDDDAIARAGTSLGERWPWRVVDVVAATFDTWREFAQPMWVDDSLVVVPAWQDPTVEDGVVAIAIEPGGAFGLGDHPTTLLSLRAARDRLADGCLADGCTVLDVGCGTGLISIMAAMLGAGVVRAIDVASAAVEATRDNALRNGVAERIEVDTAPVADLDATYDLVVANILAPTLIELADDLRRLTGPNGWLVISGILAQRHEHVLAALAPMIVERIDTLDGWAAVTLRHA